MPGWDSLAQCPSGTGSIFFSPYWKQTLWAALQIIFKATDSYHELFAGSTVLFLVLCYGLPDCTCTVCKLDQLSFSGSQDSQGSFIETSGEGGYRYIFAERKGANEQQGLQAPESCPATKCFVSCALDSDTGVRAESQRGKQAGWCHIPALLFGSSPCTPATSLPRKGHTVNPGFVCRHTNAHVVIVRRGDADLYLACCPYSTVTWSMAQGKWGTCPGWDELTLQLFLILGGDKWH